VEAHYFIVREAYK